MTHTCTHLQQQLFVYVTAVIAALFVAPVAAAQSGITVLHSLAGGGVAEPVAQLIQGHDGHFYGTTQRGGLHGKGTIYRVTAGGIVTVLHSFGSSRGDGATPQAALLLASDGNYYGTTYGGGTGCSLVGCGTAFRMTPAGVVTVVHSFGYTATDLRAPYFPSAAWVQAGDGNLYTTVPVAGLYGKGAIVRMTSRSARHRRRAIGCASPTRSAPSIRER